MFDFSCFFTFIHCGNVQLLDHLSKIDGLHSYYRTVAHSILVVFVLTLCICACAQINGKVRLTRCFYLMLSMIGITYGIGTGIGRGKRIFLPPCKRSAAIRAFLSIFFLPASTPVCCWLMSAKSRTKLINVAKVTILIDFILY